MLPDSAIEVNAASSLDPRDAHRLRALADRLGPRLRNGALLDLGHDVVPLGPHLTGMPISALWAPPPE